ncbi:MAG: sensor histidine kinase [Candidatus Nealsonbacteria bacterium]|nr:sensor histidine kinase [Candidatus Nealsonbacteria bacterium]
MKIAFWENKRIDIRKKLLIAFLLLVLATAAIINFLWLNSSQKIIKEGILRQQKERAVSAGFRIEEFIKAKKRNFILRSQSTAFLDKNIELARVELDLVLLQDKDIAEISFLDITGKELIRLAPEKVFPKEELRDRSADPAFIVPSYRFGIEYLGPVYFKGEEPSIIISVPVTIPKTRKEVEDITTAEPEFFGRFPGEIVGVIAAEVFLDDVLRSVAEVEVGKEGYVYVIDGKDTLIAHPQHDLVHGGKDVGGAAIIKKYHEKITDNRHVFGIFSDEGLNELGKKVLATFYPLASLGWGVVVQQPVSEVFSPIGRIQLFVLLLSLGILISAIFLSLVASGKFTKPIIALIEGAKKISEEEYGYRVRVATNDELQDLGETFNVMAEKLGKIRERERLIVQSKSQFIDIAAHQLRTPTSFFRWALSALVGEGMGKLNKEQKKILEKVKSANDDFISLINNLLNINRIEEGSIGYIFSYSRPEDIVLEVVEKLRPQAEEKNIKYTYNPPDSAIEPVSMDAVLMKVAIYNIIDNAIHYTPSGEISITLIKKPDSFQVSVKDTGVGIAKDEQERIFGKFFRAENSKLYTEGVGLGLYLTKGIVDRHGGKIWFESEKGMGTAFFIEIPYTKHS